MTTEMEEEILEMNNTYLKANDGDFKHIIDKSAQAAVYVYELGKGWTSAKAAGCFMLYARSGHPEMGLIILNRNAVQNWNLTLAPEHIEIQGMGNYLLLKEGRDIYCIWFYMAEDMEKVMSTLKRWGSLEVGGDTVQAVGSLPLPG